MTDRLFESHVTTNFNEDFREEFLYWPQKKFYPAYFKMITYKKRSLTKFVTVWYPRTTGPGISKMFLIRFGPDIHFLLV